MLVENVNGKRRASSILKNSMFYIEVAKFVHAYRTIIANTNEFLLEIGDAPINEQTEKLEWSKFVEIVQKCDLGFKETPTSEDLVAYYNYAIEIGTINENEQKFATVDDVANAQKHYYNFVDEAKDKAEQEYLRQRRMNAARESEYNAVDKQLSSILAQNWVAIIFMLFAGALGAFAIAGAIFGNVVLEAIGSIIPILEPRYMGAIILFIIAIIIFIIFDRIYMATKRHYKKLRHASATIFDRYRENRAVGITLKHKLNALKKDYKVVQAEINDKNKTYDVKHNIDILKSTNKYFSKYAHFEDEFVTEFVATDKEILENSRYDENEFAPIKLTKEQEENLKTVSKEAITLEGQFDVDAYNEKFEKSTKKVKAQEKAQEKEEDLLEETQEFSQNKSQEQKLQEQLLQEQEIKAQEEAEAKEKQEEELELFNSIDYIKSVLGIDENELDKDDLEKQK